jgi:hypothetical protein
MVDRHKPYTLIWYYTFGKKPATKNGDFRAGFQQLVRKLFTQLSSCFIDRTPGSSLEIKNYRRGITVTLIRFLGKMCQRTESHYSTTDCQITTPRNYDGDKVLEAKERRKQSDSTRWTMNEHDYIIGDGDD